MNGNMSPKIQIFDPPMCCPGGLCGPAIDPALLAVSDALLRLKREHGVSASRLLLQQQGAEFAKNPEVMKLLTDHGVEVLPITVVNGKVVKSRTFPSYDELSGYVNDTAATAGRA